MTLLHTLYNEKVTNIVIDKSQCFMEELIFHCLNVHRLCKVYPVTSDSEEKSDPYMLYAVLNHLDFRFA